MPPKTLMQMAGADIRPASLDGSAVLMIDAQREYVDGALPLAGIEAALEQGARLLAAARERGRPVIHVRHKGRPGGGAFDPTGPMFAIAEPVAPVAGETVIDKTLPNAFAGTDLARIVEQAGVKTLIVGGFMTHLCISSTVRAAIDHGLFSTVIASCCATRDLPDGTGGTVTADEVQRAELAALSDRFAAIAADVDAVL